MDPHKTVEHAKVYFSTKLAEVILLFYAKLMIGYGQPIGTVNKPAKTCKMLKDPVNFKSTIHYFFLGGWGSLLTKQYKKEEKIYSNSK